MSREDVSFCESILKAISGVFGESGISLMQVGCGEPFEIDYVSKRRPCLSVIGIEADAGEYANWSVRYPSVSMFHAVISDNTGDTNFNLRGEGLSSLTRAGQMTPVHALSLDDFVVVHSLPPPDVLITDCEGADHLVVAGATRVLSTARLLISETQIAPLAAGEISETEFSEIVSRMGFCRMQGFGYATGVQSNLFFEREICPK